MRIYTGSNYPLDFCDECAPTEAIAKDLYGDGIGPDDRGNCFAYDAEHPAYDTGRFTCHTCKRVLVYPPSSGLMAVLHPPAENEAIATY